MARQRKPLGLDKLWLGRTVGSETVLTAPGGDEIQVLKLTKAMLGQATLASRSDELGQLHWLYRAVAGSRGEFASDEKFRQSFANLGAQAIRFNKLHEPELSRSTHALIAEVAERRNAGSEADAKDLNRFIRTHRHAFYLAYGSVEDNGFYAAKVEAVGTATCQVAEVSLVVPAVLVSGYDGTVGPEPVAAPRGQDLYEARV